VRTIESTHVEHVRAAADFERAYADLERAVGGELPRDAHGVLTLTDASPIRDAGVER
jgi:hypothetical protein